MKKTFFASLALTAACLLFSGCENNCKTNDDEIGGEFLRDYKYVITEILCAADAEQDDAAGEIEADMQANTPFAVGSYHTFTGLLWTVTGSDGAKLVEGTYVWEPDVNFPEVISSLPPRTQVLTWRKMTVESDGNKSVYYLFVAKYDSTRSDFSSWYYDLWLYEDLTEHYRGLYPDVGVNGAVRVQVCKRNAAAI